MVALAPALAYRDLQPNVAEGRQDMEHGTIERELHIDASPEVVFDVVSNPEHVREWWPDEAEYPVVPGGEGRICFGDPADGGTWVQFTVVDAVPHRLFSFRWTHADGEAAAPGNSMLVVFELEPAGGGTRPEEHTPEIQSRQYLGCRLPLG